VKTILYVYHVSNIGGGSYCLLNILKEVNRQIYKPIVLLKANGSLVDEIRKLDIEVFFLPTLSTVPYNQTMLSISAIWDALKTIFSLKRFEYILKEISPDLVYINTMMLYPYLRIAKRKGFKTLIHIREHWPVNEHKWQRKIAIEHINRYSDQIIAINSFSSRMFNAKQKENIIVYDWIDLKDRYEYCPMSKLLGEDAKKLKVYLFTGGLQKIKGTYEVVKGFSKHITEKNERLLIMGINMKQINAGRNALIRNILALIGYKTYSFKVFEAIKNDCRIVCIPNTYRIKHILEQAYCNISYFTMPHANLALAEAIILRTPSVAALTPESLEYSNNGDLAILFNQNNENDFAEKIRLLKNNERTIHEKLRNNSYIIEDMFNKNKNVQKLDKVYKNLLS
jgi:Glycosyltransferase